MIAIDPGSHAIKVLLVEQMLGRPKILQRRAIDLPEEGLLTPEEFSQHLHEVLREIGPHPIAIPLPQTQTISVVVDVPIGPEAEQARHIEDEIVRISGLSEAAMVTDHIRLRPYGRHTNPYWVTLCQEPEISTRYARLGLDQEDLCEVTTEANALMAAYRLLDLAHDQVVLVDMGATRTVVAILHQGQGVYAASFMTGSAAFTAAIARHRGCSPEVAETLKRSTNLLAGPETVPPLRAAVEAWHQEVTQSFREWLDDHRELELKPEDFRFVLAGGGAQQPGLTDYLRRLAGHAFMPWPVGPGEEREDAPSGSLAVAFGAAAQALGCNPQPASLLPLAHREGWRSHRRLHVLQSVNASLLGLLLIILLIGTWQQYSLLRTKRALLNRTQQAIEKATSTASFARRLVSQYEREQPALESQRRTLDTLHVLSLLQQARSNRTSWLVSFADPVTYYTTLQQGVTNPAPAMTNLISGTNASSLRPSLIAEWCIPEDSEAQRRTLGSIVNFLKSDTNFTNVDLVSADRVRPIVDPKVIIAGKVFSLSLELGTNIFVKPQRLTRPTPRPAPGREPFHSLRSPFRPGERGGTNPTSAPPPP